MIAGDRSGPQGPVVVVHVEEMVSPALAGHEGVAYQSPPLPRSQALALVRVLIGRDAQAGDQLCWRCPIAGGQRTVRLEPASAPMNANGGEPGNGASPPART